MRDDLFEILGDNEENESVNNESKSPVAPSELDLEFNQKRKERVERFSINIEDGSEKISGDNKDIFSTSKRTQQINTTDVNFDLSNKYLNFQEDETEDIDISVGKRISNSQVIPNVVPEKLMINIDTKVLKEEAAKKWIRTGKVHKKSGGFLKGVVVATFIIVCSVMLSWYSISCVGDLLGITKTQDNVKVVVPAGADNETIAQILKDKGLIEQKGFFKAFLGLRYNDEEYPGFIEGEYELNGKMGYEGMILEIKYPPKEKATVRLTFPEGYSVAEIAKKLSENGVCTEVDFFKALNEEYSLKIATYIPEDERYYKLEGYLFPDTYDFYIGENPKSIVSKFLVNTQNKFTSTLKKRAEQRGMTLDEVMILASIIQKEASNPEEMGKVSSVFHNRLKNSRTYPNLQSDPTINYVEWVIKPTLTNEADFEKYAELYNTYKCTGLPVGPICSPGIEAIRAALYPESTSYYYFVTDNNNVYYYARTNAQHERNIAKVDRINEQIAKEQEEEAAEAAV